MRLIDSLATTPGLAEVFSDVSVLQSMLQFEAALAAAEARVGVIPESARGRHRGSRHPRRLRHRRTRRKIAARGNAGDSAGQRAHRARARPSEESARFVHWGATSQDVADTAIVLLLDRSRAILAADHHALQARAPPALRPSTPAP